MYDVRRVHRAIAVLLALLAVVAGCRRPLPVGTAVARPRLVVLIVIDQLPTWVFEQDRALFRGGFARLLRDGALVQAAELPHANTFTAPGHATIATGAPPSEHGVIGNQWFRRDEQRNRPAEYDPEAPVLVVGPAVSTRALPPTPAATASARALQVDGLADALRRGSGGRARSVAIGLKARAAVHVAGRAPDLAVWYEPDAGGMTTSRAYAVKPPAWLVELARARPPARFLGQTWTPLDPALLARTTGIPDDAPGEGDVHGLGVAFPHPIHDGHAIGQTPFGDEVVLDAVHASLDAMQLGDDAVPDLLAISLNAHDYAGHTWGPGSWEVLDLRVRLDLALGQLFDALDARLGRDGWAVVLTSDHGATPLLERGGIAGARRIDPAGIMAAAETAIRDQLGEGPWIATVVASQVYGTPRLQALPAAERARVLERAAVAIAGLPGIAQVHAASAVAGGCAQRGGLEQAICFAIAPGVSGELYLVPARGSSITGYHEGTHHDAPNEDNRQIPILVMAPGLGPTTVARGSQLQVAPTVAALLGIAPPSAATAPPLFGLAPAP